MGSIFSKYKDHILDYADNKDKYNLRFPLPKTSNIINNYTRGDFIVVGGRKTSGKSSFILYNYVISPLLQKIKAKANNKPFDLKVIYLNTRKNTRSTLERMIVNYYSSKSGGNKIGVPSLYGLEGKHVSISREGAKELISTTMTTFDTLVEKGILSVSPAKKSLYEVDNLIRSTMLEYGTMDDEHGEFTYLEKYKDLIVLISIDDVTGILTETGGNNIKNDSAHQLAIKLKGLAKLYNVVLVLSVPSDNVYTRAGGHVSSLNEIAPYHLYADRALIMHNPAETGDKNCNGYNTGDFINPSTGVCYLRSILFAANYMGPSGMFAGYFLYPENGFMMELPPSEKEEELEVFMDIATKRI